MTKIVLGKGRYVQSMIGLATEVVIEAMKDLGGEYIILAVPLDEWKRMQEGCEFCNNWPNYMCEHDWTFCPKCGRRINIKEGG